MGLYAGGGDERLGTLFPRLQSCWRSAKTVLIGNASSGLNLDVSAHSLKRPDKRLLLLMVIGGVVVLLYTQGNH